MSRYYELIGDAIDSSIRFLKQYGVAVDTGHWQGVSTEGKPDLVTKEIGNLSWVSRVPPTRQALGNAVNPNFPWAEDEFQERVGGEPHNPHHSLGLWPWWQGQEGQTMYEGMFTHTYSERFWPKKASTNHREWGTNPLHGVRFDYGDLDDVVNLLLREPYTRQATLPIFFPEDTGAVHGGRIPCTLHYHFLLRDNQLHLWYAIRSCDAVRHYRDDVYMAARLCQWMIGALKKLDVQPGKSRAVWDKVKPGFLHFTAYSFHVHMGDYHLLES